MGQKLKIAIQGHPGSFHDQVREQYFGNEAISIAADSFEALADLLTMGAADYGIMAIENSIAGSILQNYRILRERKFWIIGEKYLRIKMNLMAIKGVDISNINQVHSHPMALNQCLKYLSKYPNLKLVESEDTALSAKIIHEQQLNDTACIASDVAASLYHLNILAEGIETNKVNYTRFFIIAPDKMTEVDKCNKASMYIRIPDVKGRLLEVLQLIHKHDLNLSKLQSFPVLGHFREYFFHLDIEFDSLEQYSNLKKEIDILTTENDVLGIYKRDQIEVYNS